MKNFGFFNLKIIIFREYWCQYWWPTKRIRSYSYKSSEIWFSDKSIKSKGWSNLELNLRKEKQREEWN